MGASLRHEAGFITADDGTLLFCQGVRPPGAHLASVALVHGYNSFSDWMLPMMAVLAEHGLACYAIDYRGHGLSGGVPRHVFHFREYLSDLRALCGHVSERAGEGQVYIYGTSLGGLIASVYGLFHPDQLRGTVVTAPFFGPAFRVPRTLDLCARAVSCCFPTLRIPRRRPDLPRYTTFRWWTETIAAQQLLRRRAKQFRLPVFALHGENDPVACPVAAEKLIARMGSEDKTFRIIPGAGHQDLDPPCGTGWWTDVAEWITSRAVSRERSRRSVVSGLSGA